MSTATETILDALVERAGSQAELSRRLGHPCHTRVAMWRYRGSIPEWRLREIIEVAEELGVPDTEIHGWLADWEAERRQGLPSRARSR